MKITQKILVTLLFVFTLKNSNAQIPVLGDTNTIEIGNWNIEWFGNTGYGPTNETLQQTNVYNVLNTTNVDLWGLCEISDSTAWKNLVNKLPAYGSAISTWSQTQKTGLLFKKEHFKLLYSKNILAEYDREFASGRMPLEVGLEVNFKNKKDTLIVFVIHLKANTGNNTEKAAAHDLRKRSSQFLKEYIDARYLTKNYVIIGDWNDDLDVSIYNNIETPFSMMLADTTDYFFTSLALTKSGKKSTVSYSNMIDHQSISNRMKNFYVYNSAQVIYLNTLISNYGSTTTDHYPVVSKYDFSRKVIIKNSNIFNPKNETTQIKYLNGKFYLSNNEIPEIIKIYTVDGKEIDKLNLGLNQIYLVKIKSKTGMLYSSKFLITNSN